MAKKKSGEVVGDSPTTDIDEFKERRVEEREARWQSEEVEGQTEARKAGTDNGNKREYSVEDEYAMREGERRTKRAKKRESNPNPSPLNESK